MTKFFNRKYFFLFSLFALLLFLIIFFIRYINQPSTSKILPANITNSEVAKITEPQIYPGPYVTFTYPSDLILDQITEIDSGLLTKIILNSRDLHAKRIVATLATVSASTIDLSSIPAVSFRRLPDSDYLETNLELDNFTWTVFEKKSDLHEQTAFTIADGVVYTFAYTSSINAPGIATDLLTVLKSLEKL